MLKKSKTTSTTKKTGNELLSLFVADIREAAIKATHEYNIIIQEHEELGYVGTSLEMPTVFANTKIQEECFKKTMEAMTLAAATMIECGKVPPEAFSSKKRNVQINIRVNSREKLLLNAASQKFGFKGLSDFIRSYVLREILSP